MLIANKLAPMPVQPDKTGDKSLQDCLREDLAGRGDPADSAAAEASSKPPTGSIAEPPGAVLFAKTHIALSTLEAAFRDKRVEKEYLACVEREPEPPEGRLEHRLAWDKRRNIVRSYRPDSVSGKPALLDYALAGRSDHYFFVTVILITGRHHQVRAQLAAIGCPIRGDLKYGARRSSPSGLIMLHARRLAFSQPRTQARVEVARALPSGRAAVGRARGRRRYDRGRLKVHAPPLEVGRARAPRLDEELEDAAVGRREQRHPGTAAEGRADQPLDEAAVGDAGDGLAALEGARPQHRPCGQRAVVEGLGSSRPRARPPS